MGINPSLGLGIKDPRLIFYSLIFYYINYLYNFFLSYLNLKLRDFEFIKHANKNIFKINFLFTQNLFKTS